MLFLPLVAGFVVGGRVDAAVPVAALMVFFGYVTRAPAEVVLRGRRSQLGWLIGYLAVAAALAVVLAGPLDRRAWLAIGVAVAPVAAIALALGAAKRSREVVAELLGAILLPASAALAHAVGREAVEAEGLLLWLAFALYNAATVPYVRTWVYARRAGRNPEYAVSLARVRRAASATLWTVATVVVALAAARLWPAWTPIAYLPGLARIVIGLRRAEHVELPIQALGWREMAHAMLFTVLVTAASRAA